MCNAWFGSLKKVQGISIHYRYQGCESSDFNLISDFLCSSQNHIFRLLMQVECIEKHFFSGFSDYFRLFLTDALTPLNYGIHERRLCVECHAKHCAECDQVRVSILTIHENEGKVI